ncbi:uncharacterized protein PV06_08320 [Exophiala oligosperma]|uniref:Uncharacterized protein n=1 Tax=Exophiala oligosperma TaxID=215243 RepID=A0A0D2AHV5_9EURO|nr:uncharacterized protein PV06_08320 [Exophiala oligosperma]KIW39731.1 hypothetical protein PV06_08320 [Exophiala oligosperma]
MKRKYQRGKQERGLDHTQTDMRISAGKKNTIFSLSQALGIYRLGVFRVWEFCPTLKGRSLPHTNTTTYHNEQSPSYGGILKTVSLFFLQESTVYHTHTHLPQQTISLVLQPLQDRITLNSPFKRAQSVTHMTITTNNHFAAASKLHHSSPLHSLPHTHTRTHNNNEQ